MTFEELLATRSSADYADFFLPHVATGSSILDAGCGSGAITVGLAEAAGHVIGIDLAEDFTDARDYAARHGIRNVEFQTGNVYMLNFPDDHFDACFCHSMLEATDHPIDALREIRRILKPGGVLAAASVDYGGLILAGPNYHLLRQFYDIRERLWRITGSADPYRGRGLRGLLTRAGFSDVVATSKYVCYGTAVAVRSFGIGRADDCQDDWYASASERHGLATGKDLLAMTQAWLDWSESSESYAAFAWCRAVGYKPTSQSLSVGESTCGRRSD